MTLFKIVLITGGTGSLGQQLARMFLKHGYKVRIFSRNENLQHEMKEKFNNSMLKFFLGDVRDKPRLYRAMENVDIVIHAAALKHVDAGEYNPFEFINTNVLGSQNVIDCCIEREVRHCIAISSDKAVNPSGVYGATKLLMEKIFLAADNIRGSHKTKFACIRLGNLFNSNGSVVQKFKTQNKLQVTDLNATRFTMTVEKACLDIVKILEVEKTGLIIPKLRAYILRDLVEAFDKPYDITGLRPGEKLHEEMEENVNSNTTPKLTKEELVELIECLR